MTIRKHKISKISALHYYKLVFRSALLLLAFVLYLVDRVKNDGAPFQYVTDHPVILGLIGLIFTVEMILRFFPSDIESMGCQKQFRRNFIPTERQEPGPRPWKSILAVFLFWVLLNGIIAGIYYLGWIDAGILVLISLAYSVCDMICILFFCPFQTWFMKNKCCGSCRIYNWDYAMMFTPLLFVPHPLARILFLLALLLALVWEFALILHPERFSEETNACLSCKNCKEKLCHHKRQLRHFLRANKDVLLLRGNAVVEKARRRINEKNEKHGS
jgi:hypothetical protein